jgi:hypothetical protein
VAEVKVLIALGYAFWIGLTLWVCYLIIGMAQFFTMDTQDYRTWIIAIAIALAVAVLSGYGLCALS